MKVVINVPDRDYGRLVVAAENMGMRVPEMIMAAAVELMPWRSTTEQRVDHLVRSGLTDDRIAERMSIPKWKVARVRQGLNLKPNQIMSRAGRVMSWGLDIELTNGDMVEIVDGHTYNLTPMWRLAGVIDDRSSDLEGVRADVLADRAARGLMRAVTQPAAFKRLNPENGWGDYDGFVEILTRTAVMCAEHREGIVRWNG